MSLIQCTNIRSFDFHAESSVIRVTMACCDAQTLSPYNPPLSSRSDFRAKFLTRCDADFVVWVTTQNQSPICTTVFQSLFFILGANVSVFVSPRNEIDDWILGSKLEHPHSAVNVGMHGGVGRFFCHFEIGNLSNNQNDIVQSFLNQVWWLSTTGIEAHVLN
eukprot:g11366.t1